MYVPVCVGMITLCACVYAPACIYACMYVCLLMCAPAYVYNIVHVCDVMLYDGPA